MDLNRDTEGEKGLPGSETGSGESRAWSLGKWAMDDVGRLEHEVQRESGRRGTRSMEVFIRWSLMLD